jgi:two-component system OmpR family sensor kinase
MRTLRQQLLVWLLGGTLVCSMVAGSALYLKVREEANELFDVQLRQVTQSLPASTGAPDPDGREELEDKVVVQVWDQKGMLVYSSSPQAVLPRYTEGGYRTVKIGGKHWRIYAKNRQSVFIQAAQPVDVREALAKKIAMRSLFPFLILIPALAILIWIVVGRSMRPLNRLADAVGRRSADALQPLSADGLPPEIRPVVDALNDLLEQLDHALATQRAFVADAAHELRSPLTALKLQLQLAEYAANDEQRAVAFHKLHDRLDRASRLVQQLLTLARQEPGYERDYNEAVNLQLLAQQIVADYYVLAERRKIDLGVETSSLPLVVQGNADGLRILLSNLVDNALRYSAEGGKVDISTPVIDGCPALRIADHGPGIVESDQTRVFDRFYRGEEASAWGSGLGLAIVKNIADAHAATIHLTTTSEKHGLTVTLVFEKVGIAVSEFL